MKLVKGQALCMLPMYEKKFLTGNTRCDLHPGWEPFRK